MTDISDHWPITIEIERGMNIGYQFAGVVREYAEDKEDY